MIRAGATLAAYLVALAACSSGDPAIRDPVITVTIPASLPTCGTVDQSCETAPAVTSPAPSTSTGPATTHGGDSPLTELTPAPVPAPPVTCAQDPDEVGEPPATPPCEP